MGTLTKKLHILKTGGTEETCNIYTTAEEVGGSPYLALEVDGAKGYVKLGSTTDANATHLRVEKDGVIYAAWKEAVTYVNVTITQSANQTIHVYTPQKSGGTDHTSSFTIPTGSKVVTVDYGNIAEITIPDGVRVVKVSGNYIGVTPNKKYELTGWIPFIHHTGDEGEPFLRNAYSDVYWDGTSPKDYPDTKSVSYTVYWSSAINAHKPDITDY